MILFSSSLLTMCVQSRRVSSSIMWEKDVDKVGILHINVADHMPHNRMNINLKL